MQNETKKRLDIAQNITNEIFVFIEGALLGGSMGYGQNYSVTKDSDIDFVIVCKKENIDKLTNTDYFKNQIPLNVINLFKDSDINMFWLTKEIDGVEVNTFTYELDGYKNYCNFKDSIKSFIKEKPQDIQESYGFDGELIKFTRNVKPISNGYIYERSVYANNKFWNVPPRSDFLIGYHALHEKNNIFNEMREIVWSKTINKLIEEYGKNPDLKKYNILNADFTYHQKPEKLSKQLKMNIQEETKERLMNMNKL